MARRMLPLLMVAILVTSASAVRNQSVYHQLVTELLDGEKYNAQVMPICDTKNPLEVGQDMVLYQLYDLDEPTQQLTIDSWIETVWKDCRISWNPADYNGIKEIAVRASEIWFPQLIFYQSLHGNFEEGLFIYGESTARIRHDGMIQLGCQVMLKSFCRVKLAYFPYDYQVCNLTFVSWTADANMLRLRTKVGDSQKTSDHTFENSGNGEWDVMGFPSSWEIVNRNVGFNESEARPYAEVTFQLRLKRKYLFHKVYMIFPCMLMSWLAILVFIMPIESGEKITFITTLFLALIVFLLLVADNIPRSSDAVPIMGVYFTMAVVYVGSAVLATILVLNIGLKQKDVCLPRWLRYLLRSKFTKVVCFKYSPTAGTQKWFSVGKKKAEDKPGPDADNDNMMTTELVGNGDEVPAGAAMPPCGSARNDWRLLATVLDRYFFWILVILNIISTIYICVSGPPKLDW